MTAVSWSSQAVWRRARTNREYVRRENDIPIEALSTDRERADWIARIERDKAEDVSGYHTKAYDELLGMVKGGPRDYGFDVALGDYEVRKVLNDRLDAAHEAAAQRFVEDTSNRLPIDEDAWQDESRRRADFEHWLEMGEPIKTTTQPEFISDGGDLQRMVRARENNEAALALDFAQFRDEIDRQASGLCIDVFGCDDPVEWERRMKAAYRQFERQIAAEISVRAYLKARGATVTRSLSERP